MVQRIYGHRRLRMWWQGRASLLLGLLAIGLLLVGGKGALATTAEPRAAPSSSEPTPAPGASQERFLQHFISRSLVQTTADERQTSAATPAASAPQHQRAVASTTAMAPSLELGASLGSTVTTMVLALGAILGCLLLAAYLLRRYLFSQTAFGKRATSLRVLARAHLTPKAVVALLEVPGKTLVIGVTGSTIITLGEVALDTENKDAPPSNTHGTSFAVTLEQSANALNDASPGDETLLQVSERIQRKVSRLKQL